MNYVRQFSNMRRFLVGAPQRTLRHAFIVLKLFVLRTRQHVLALRIVLQVEAPNCLAAVVEKDEFGTEVLVVSRLRKTRERIDKFTALIDLPHVCEAFPGESAVGEFDFVAFVGCARGRVEAVDT